jgi:hypothetical protein
MATLAGDEVRFRQLVHVHHVILSVSKLSFEEFTLVLFCLCICRWFWKQRTSMMRRAKKKRRRMTVEQRR